MLEDFEYCKQLNQGAGGGSGKLNGVLKKGLMRRRHSCKDSMEIRECDMQRSGGQLFQAAGTVSAKSLRQECGWNEGQEPGGQLEQREQEGLEQLLICSELSNRGQIL